MAESDLFFAKQQNVTASAFSTNALDIGAARKLFGGFNKKLRLVVEVTAINGITCTIGTKLTAGNTSATNNSAGDVLVDVTTPTLTAAVAAGSIFEYAIPRQPTARRYYGVYFTLGGATDVTLNCYIAEAPQENLTV